MPLQAVLKVIPGYHPIYKDAPASLLVLIDDSYAHGLLSRVASFTHSAIGLCREHGALFLSEAVARALLELHAGGHVEHAA